MAGRAEEPGREAGAIAVGTAIVFLIVLAAFQHMGTASEAPAAGPGMSVDTPGGAADTTSDADVSWPAGTVPFDFQDPDLGLVVGVPRDWERVIDAATTSGDAADVAAVFRNPATGGELRLEAWDARGRPSFSLWVGVVAGAMIPVGDAPLPNAVVAGTPARLLWVPPGARAGGEAGTSESAPPPGGAAEYAAFLEHDGRYYRLSYVAGRGGEAPDAFRAVLASLRWPASDAPGRIPALPSG